ncbi:MAG: IS4 family transposase [Planctomycetaceae bacterium]
MPSLELEIEVWAGQQFGACDLGDERRTRRLVKLAAQTAALPDGSTPQQTECWADCKAAYRLFDRREVTFEAVCGPHWEQVGDQASGTWLLIGDTTEICIMREVSGLGPTGNGQGRGFFLHTSLMLNAESQEVVGVAGAELFHRQPIDSDETKRASKNRPRESEVWGRVIERVGSPRGSARFIHVLDAGADNFEVFGHLYQQQCGWVVRAAQRSRTVWDEAGAPRALLNLVQRQSLAGTYELSLRAREKHAARTAKIEVRFVRLRMPPPQAKTPWMKACGITEIPMWAVEAREVDAPANVEPLHWVLLTSEAVDTFDDAWTILGWYEQRPIVEDYHKCLKTGCRVEQRQYKASQRLECVAGLLSIVAVRLLQLKFVARTDPERPAARIVPRVWLRILQALRRQRKPIKTVGDFFRSLAMLGGFLGRKCDGQPGWITIWRGFETLNLCLRGIQLLPNKCG